MTARRHLSIGEVLNLLQDEFPDITISKIRFLESQGLLDPERTPSGYRKFYEGDIDRLRWILRQQRENFLPLKVIKDRLAAGELDDAPSEPMAGRSSEAPPELELGAPPVSQLELVSLAAEAGPETHEPRVPEQAPVEELIEVVIEDVSPDDAGGADLRAADRSGSGDSHLVGLDGSVSMSADELCAAAGLSPKELTELERYDLITPRSLGPTSYYDEDALVVARLAGRFMAHGVDARNLRMYKIAAEREAAMLEQLTLPILKQRNPQARQHVTSLVDELGGLGGQLRSALLAVAVHDYLG